MSLSCKKYQANMGIVAKILFCFLITPLSAASQLSSKEEPNLHELLCGVNNAEIQIIYGSSTPSPETIFHFHLLPTTIFHIDVDLQNQTQRDKFLPQIGFNILQGRSPRYRISYTFTEHREGSHWRKWIDSLSLNSQGYNDLSEHMKGYWITIKPPLNNLLLLVRFPPTPQLATDTTPFIRKDGSYFTGRVSFHMQG